MSSQPSFLNLLNATSSPELASGLMPYDKQAGETIKRSGQCHTRANLTAAQAKEMDLLTSGTLGPSGIISLESAALQSSLANKLQAKMVSLGSTLYKLTLKERATPAGRMISAQRASALRTSGNANIFLQKGWPTPTKTDALKMGKVSPRKGMMGLAETLAYLRDNPSAARLMVSGEMRTGSTAEMESGGQLNPAHSRWLMGLPSIWDLTAPLQAKVAKKC